MSGEGLTIRLEDDRGIVSRDDGTSSSLDSESASTIRTLAENVQTPIQQTSAVAVASLAEARFVEPRPTAGAASATVELHGPEIRLGTLVRPLQRPFGEVLERRQSERRFRSLGLDDLATLLVHAARVRGWTDSEDGYQMSTRPSPSAGARHPYELEVIIDDIAGVTPGLWWFDAADCRLVHRHIAGARIARALSTVNAAAGLMRNAPATILIVAHFKRTLARYPAGSTLVWRDAGAVAASLHLVASAAGLASCIVGTSGVLESDHEALITDVAAVVVGRRRIGRHRD